jgi:hypothetical protein
MNEKKKRLLRLLVASLFYISAFIVLAVGALMSWHVYETYTSPRNRWMWCDCCFGECYCGVPPVGTVLVVGIQFFIINLTAIVLAGLFTVVGASYYKCGRFECPIEKE